MKNHILGVEATLKEIGVDILIKLNIVKASWKRAHYRAIINWLKKYTPSEKASNLEKVKGYIEAFYHCCEAEEYGVAINILSACPSPSTRTELHTQLGLWAYYQQQLWIYYQLLEVACNTDDLALQGNTLGNLGDVYHDLGDYRQALKYHQDSLATHQKINDRLAIGRDLGNIGCAYNSLSNYSEAIKYRQLASKRIKKYRLKLG